MFKIIFIIFLSILFPAISNCQYLQIDVVYPISKHSIMLLGNDTLCNLTISQPVNFTPVGKDLYRTQLYCTPRTSHVLEFGIFLMDDEYIWRSLERHMYKVEMGYEDQMRKIILTPFFNFAKNSGKILNFGQFPYSKRGIMKDISLYFPPNFLENTAKNFSHFGIVNDGQELPLYVPFFERSIISGDTHGDMILISISQVYKTEERYIEFSKHPCNITTCPSICSFKDFSNVGGGLDDYLDWIETDLIPNIVQTVPELKNRVHLQELSYSMYGTSFGGYAAGWACYSRPDRYKACSAQSANWNWNCESFYQHIKTHPIIPSKDVPKFYIDYGSFEYPQTGCVEEEALRVVQALKDQNITVMYVKDVGGIHIQGDWAFRLPAAIRFLESPELQWNPLVQSSHMNRKTILKVPEEHHKKIVVEWNLLELL